MDGHDEWELFTQADMEEERRWHKYIKAWKKAFVKSRRRNVWVVHVKGAYQYACELVLFDSEEAAKDYLEQLAKSQLKHICPQNIHPRKDWRYYIGKLPIYKCHKEVKEI